MPYIKKEMRDKLRPAISKLANTMNENCNIFDPGMFNYVITQLVLDLGVPLRYEGCNAIVGALECAKLEYYRRRVAPYENTKATENGEVY